MNHVRRQNCSVLHGENLASSWKILHVIDSHDHKWQDVQAVNSNLLLISVKKWSPNSQGCISHTTTSCFSLFKNLQPLEHSKTAVRKLMTQCAESQHKKQHGSDGAAGCGSDGTTQIHRLNNPELDKVQAPPQYYLLMFLATTAICIFNL